MSEQPIQAEMKSGPIEAETAEAGETENPSLRELCETRRQELVDALGLLADDGSRTRRDIEAALAALETHLTGDLDHIPAVVAAELARWLESSKYLGAKEARELAAPPPA